MEFVSAEFKCPRCYKTIKKQVRHDNVWIMIELYFKCTHCEINLQTTCRFKMTPAGLILTTNKPVEHILVVPDIGFKRKR